MSKTYEDCELCHGFIPGECLEPLHVETYYDGDNRGGMMIGNDGCPLCAMRSRMEQVSNERDFLLSDISKWSRGAEAKSLYKTIIALTDERNEARQRADKAEAELAAVVAERDSFRDGLQRQDATIRRHVLEIDKRDEELERERNRAETAENALYKALSAKDSLIYKVKSYYRELQMYKDSCDHAIADKQRYEKWSEFCLDEAARAFAALEEASKRADEKRAGK